MKTLIERLNKIQRELKAVKSQSAQGGQYHYRNAEDLMQAVKPLLGVHFVCMIKQDVVSVEGQRYFKATAALTDGENSLTATGWAREPENIMQMSQPQVSGSCQSYAAKYALQALFLTDNNPDIDSAAQYQEELESFADYIRDFRAFDFYMLSCTMEPEAGQAVWNMYKNEYIGKGEITNMRENISALKEAGRLEALRAVEAFNEGGEVEEEARAEYTEDQQAFIETVS